jgi:hypothetical protein
MLDLSYPPQFQKGRNYANFVNFGGGLRILNKCDMFGAQERKAPAQECGHMWGPKLGGTR